MNILFLCGWYPSRVLPNNGDFVQRHAKAVSLQHNVEVLHIISDKNATQNIELISEEIDGIKTHIGYIKKTSNPILKLVWFWKAYTRLLKKTAPFDMVHLNEVFPFGIFALHLKWFKKKPFIISEHWTDYKHPLSEKIPFLQKEISKKIVKNASFVCPVTKDLEKSMISFGLKGNYKRVENVVNTKKFSPIEHTNEMFTILHISNMNNIQKNVSGFLNVISKLQHRIPNLKVKIIGENSYKYLTASENLGIKPNLINFTNQIPHKQVIKHLQTANLFVLFSNHENLPCVILESFSCGTPVISTNVGGINEFFPDNFGKLIPTKNEQKLEKEIVNFYHGKNIMASKKEMHDYVDTHFSEISICQKFSDIYIKSLSI